DIDNDFNPYVGTWVYTNGNTSLKVIFQKKEMMQNNLGSNMQYFRDYLIGEYQYIENGIEKVNTLPNLLSNHSDRTDYNIRDTGIILKYIYPKCEECSDTERRISMSFTEPSRRNSAGLFGGAALRHFTENGVEKIKLVFYQESYGNGYRRDNLEPLESEELKSFTLPIGTYILTKVE